MAVKHPLGERDMCTRKGQKQKCDPHQQVEEPLGVQEPGTYKIAKFTQDATGQPVRADELRPQLCYEESRPQSMPETR
jgi:hypothetical protein